MRAITLLSALLVALAAVAQPAGPPPGGPPAGGPPRGGRPDFLLPPNWWHDASLAKTIKLSEQQKEKLEQLQKTHGESLATLERDSMTALRNLSSSFDEGASSDRILAAGNRFASLRDQILRKQLALAAAQRAVVTAAQWAAARQHTRRPL